MQIFKDTLNKREALEAEGIVNPLRLPSTSSREHSNYSMACYGEEAIHSSPPMLCMRTGRGGAAGGGLEVLPPEWRETSAVAADSKEPRAAKVHDVPTVAATCIWLFLADDATDISSDQNRGVVSLPALHLWYLGCELFRAAIASHCEHFQSFGWKGSSSYYGLLPNPPWCRAVWRQCIPLQTRLHKPRGSLDLLRPPGLQPISSRTEEA